MQLFPSVLPFTTCDNVHTQEKTTAYVGGENVIQTRGKTYPQHRAYTLKATCKNSRPLQYKQSKERSIELYRLDEWKTSLTELQKRILRNFNKLKSKIRNQLYSV
jgi:hypothetical protein